MFDVQNKKGANTFAELDKHKDPGNLEYTVKKICLR